MSSDEFSRGFNSAGGDLNSPDARRGHAEWQRQEQERANRNAYKPTPAVPIPPVKVDFPRQEHTPTAKSPQPQRQLQRGRTPRPRVKNGGTPPAPIWVCTVIGALIAATYAWLSSNGSLNLVAVYAAGGAIAGAVILALAIIFWKLVIIAVKIVAAGTALAFVGAVLWIGLQDKNQVKEQFTGLKPAPHAQEQFTGLKPAPHAQPQRNQLTYDQLLAIPKNGTIDFGK